MSTGKRHPWWAVALVGLLVVGLVLTATYAAGDVFPEYFDTRFHQLLTANLLGVAIGAFFAFAVDRRRAEERERRKETKAENDRIEEAKKALGALKDAVDHNDELVKRAKKSISMADDVVVYFSTDFKGIDPILPRVLDSTENLDLVRAASDYRHDLKHLTRQLEAQFELFMHPDYAKSQQHVGKELRRKRSKLIHKIQQDEAPDLLGAADDLRAQIEEARGDP